MKIVFCHTGRAHLPELSAYIEFASSQNIECDVVIYDEVEKASLSDCNVLWNFMGRDISFKTYSQLKKNKCLYIREFASCSVKPFPRIKNFIKSISPIKVDAEVYLNPLVEREFRRKLSSAPKFYRDMGVSDSFFSAKKQYTPKKYDFVYVGAMDDTRRISLEIERLLVQVGGSVLLIGEPSPLERSILANLPGVTITGRVPYEDVPKLLASAHIGLNIMPDEYPYNIQTSTKLIEYLALGIPVISNSYKWVSEFIQNEGCHEQVMLVDSFSYVTHNIIKSLREFKCHESGMQEKSWCRVIDESGIFQYLMAKINEE